MKMMTLQQYVVDAFTDKVFHGNPAAVCVLPAWLSDQLMQQIAIENNLSETAFTVKNADHYELAGLRLVAKLIFVNMLPWLQLSC